MNSSIIKVPLIDVVSNNMSTQHVLIDTNDITTNDCTKLIMLMHYAELDGLRYTELDGLSWIMVCRVG